MEHTLPQIRTTQLQSGWRTATLVASAVAALELVVLLVLGVAILAEPVASHVAKAAEHKVMAPVAKPKPPPAVGAPKLTRAETSVIVLNGNGQPGAAAIAAERVRGIGYTIGTVGNAPRADFTRSLVMYRPGHEAEAKRLARDLRLKLVGPLDGIKPRELLGAHVAFVVGE